MPRPKRAMAGGCGSCPEKKKKHKLSPGLSTLLGDVCGGGGKGRGHRIRPLWHISALPLADYEALSQ